MISITTNNGIDDGPTCGKCMEGKHECERKGDGACVRLHLKCEWPGMTGKGKGREKRPRVGVMKKRIRCRDWSRGNGHLYGLCRDDSHAQAAAWLHGRCTGGDWGVTKAHRAGAGKGIHLTLAPTIMNVGTVLKLSKWYDLQLMINSVAK